MKSCSETIGGSICQKRQRDDAQTIESHFYIFLRSHIMIPAVKHFDPVMGVDTHFVYPPGSPSPVPIPHPFIGMIFDPVDYLPMIGATVYVNGLPAAVAGTGGRATPSHIPIGGTFVAAPGNEGEMFMGSSTVTFDGFPASYGGLPVLTCQGVGMPPPPRPRSKKTTPTSMVLPTSTVMPVPAGMPVLVGGSPTISMMALGMRAAMAGLAKGFSKGLKKLKKTKVGKGITKLSRRAKKKASDLKDKIGISKASRNSNQVPRSKCTKTGHPVDVATGKVFTDEVDLELPGPLPLKFERVWTSTSTYEGPLGHGWHHNYDMALWTDEEDGVAVVRLQDGRYAEFALPAEEEPSYNRQEKLWLRRTADGYRLDEELGNRQYVFEKGRTNSRRGPAPDQYRLERVQDRNGNTIQLRYDRRGHLETIIDSAGRRLTITTDRAGRITEIIGPHPDDSDRRVLLLRYRYNHKGDLVEVRDALGEPIQYEYDNHLLVKETDRAGVSFYFQYDGTDENARCIKTWGTGGIYARTLEYDDVNQTTTVVDTREAETVYHWNDMGLVTKVVGPTGSEATYTYDEDALKLSKTDALGNTTEYEYDERGRLVTVTNADGETREITYDEEGNLVALENELGDTWARSFDERGNLTAVTDPEGNTTCYEPSRRGLLETIVDAKGEELTLDWDGAGNLERVVDRTGAETELEYDRLGRLVRRVNAEGGQTELHRDVLGRITKVDDAEDRQSTFRYDAAGNLTSTTDPLGRTQTLKYGPHGPGGELEEITKPSGATTQYQYNSEGELVEVRDATGRTWKFVRDKIGRIVEERDFTGRRLAYVYDEVGRLVETTNGRGETTWMERNARGQLTQRTYADGRTEKFAYDKIGRLTEASNEAATVEIEYDSLGRITKEIQNGEEVAHRYDAVGNRVKRVSSKGRELTFDYDEEGRLQEVQDPAGRLMRLHRDELGREVQRSLPSGITTEREYSTGGRLLSQRTTRREEERPLLNRNYTYDSAGKLQKIADSRFGTTEFGYDVDGALEQVIHPEGELEQFVYDDAGNVPGAPVRLDRAGGDGESGGGDGRAGAEPTWSPAEEDGASSEEGRTIAATQVSEGWTLSYDLDGNLIRKHNDETEYRFYYDAAGRMERAEQDGEEVARFAYDPLGRRVEKDTPEKTVTYQWNGEQLLSERAQWKNIAQDEVEEERVEREYIFSGFEPLAALSKEGDQLFETDQVGTPRLAVNRDGDLVWEGDFSGFGESREEHGREEVEVRYPGQIYDEETGLSYNRFRYYDPELRCYTQSDPIGLEGGVQLHGYVKDPNFWFDPYGLTSCNKKSWNAEEKGYPGIKTTEKGNPDFSESDYLYDGDADSIVTIELQGTRQRDFTEAGRQAGLEPPSDVPEGYTWHHMDDFDPDTGTSTMQLVETEAHEATFPHRGSVAQYVDHHGEGYSSSSMEPWEKGLKSEINWSSRKSRWAQKLDEY